MIGLQAPNIISMIFILSYFIAAVGCSILIIWCVLFGKDTKLVYIISVALIFIVFVMQVFFKFDNKNYSQIGLELQFIGLMLQFWSVIFIVDKIPFISLSKEKTKKNKIGFRLTEEQEKKR